MSEMSVERHCVPEDGGWQHCRLEPCVEESQERYWIDS